MNHHNAMKPNAPHTLLCFDWCDRLSNTCNDTKASLARNSLIIGDVILGGGEDEDDDEDDEEEEEEEEEEELLRRRLIYHVM